MQELLIKNIYKSLIKNKKKKHNKILSLAKSKLNSVEILVSNALIDSNISHDELVLISNVPKEFDDIKEEIKSSYNNKSLNYIHKTRSSYCLK